MARKPTEVVHLKLRLPEALRRQLEKAAAQNSRSMNSEILQRLEDSFRHGSLDALIQKAAQTAAIEAFRVVGSNVALDRPKKPDDGGEK
jgi:Arc-like DNA binding dprotein